MASHASEVLRIRDAATLILVRDPAGKPSILMGRRLKGAVFMPGKFVFPGGAVDPDDAALPLKGALGATCRARLAEAGGPPERFAAAAIRELREETGLGFATPDADAGIGPGRYGHPRPAVLTYVYRAITPPGRTRRFDARFFLADAAHLANDTDDFTGASGELSDLGWVNLHALDGLDIAPVTRAVLAFVLPRLPDLGPPPTLPVRG